MGANDSVILANLALIDVEKEWRNFPGMQFLLYFRYVDDILALVVARPDVLKQFCAWTSTISPPLKVNWEVSTSSVAYLDLQVSMGSRFQTERHLDLSLHRKACGIFPYF